MLADGLRRNLRRFKSEKLHGFRFPESVGTVNAVGWRAGSFSISFSMGLARPSLLVGAYGSFDWRVGAFTGCGLFLDPIT